MILREIKFRAWLKEFEFMIEPKEIGSVGNDEVRLKNPWNIENQGWVDTYSRNEVEVMQYTGLKDKNGREIYEGDILRVWQEDEYIPNRDSGGGIIDYDCEGGFSQIGKVGFTGCSFDYSTVKTLVGRHEKIHEPIDWINNYEIIGNIYENLELLEVQA